ncbi:MAG: AMP-binding protein [Proteobacteria bacterium]|nr:AMP-binding protein [Pseudomonadota bacterium]
MGVDIVDITAKRAALTPNGIALVDPIGGRKITYAMLEQRAARAASAFAAHGVAREDRVAILCRNRIEFFEAMFACAKIGAILVPLNWRAPAAELACLLDDCSPRLMLFGREDKDCATRLRRAGLNTIALDSSDGYEALLADSVAFQGERRWSGDAIWSLLYTSGTTGSPKAVIQTFQMAAINAFHTTQAFGIANNDHTLNFLPLFHTAGIHLLTMPTLMAGGVVSVLPHFDASQVLALMPTLDTFFAVPTIYQQLAQNDTFEATDLSHVRAWGCGGAPLPDALAERFSARGARVCNGYGMTETGPTAFVAAPEDALTKIGSVGKPQMFLDVRIVDDKGDDVAEGNVGEIWMRGAGLTPGYWRRPEETAHAFTSDGWLKSGDIGHRDADGCYYVAGRIKEMYISGGENVYPAEIENVLAHHPDIVEAAVIGVPDMRWGEVGCAFIVLRGDKSLDAVALTLFCRERIAAYKAPARFIAVSTLPRNATGKVQKQLLQPEALSRNRYSAAADANRRH